MIRPTGQFNRLSFFTHLEVMKRKLLQEGGERAAMIVPVLEQLQEDIDQWATVKRYKRAYGACVIADRLAQISG